MNPRRVLNLGAVLMILLGLARSAGGLVLLSQGAGTDPDIRASDATCTAAGGFLLALGAGLIVSAVGVLRRHRRSWLLGIVLTVAFVVDGAVNGYFLYGRPGDQGTVVNVFAAALILTCLFAGARALGDGGARGDAGAPGDVKP